MTVATFVLSIVAILISVGSTILARRSALAVGMSRSDNLGPVISITNERALRERWYWDAMHHENNPEMGAPCEIEPLKVLQWPGNKGVRILLGAHVTIANEGSLTTTVSINARISNRCDSYDDYKATTTPTPAPSTIATPTTAIPNGKLVLKPGEKKGVIIRNGPSLEEWRNNGRGQPIAIEISAKTLRGGARQRWKIKLASPLLERDQFNDSTYRVARFQLPQIKLTELPREYPFSVRRRKND